MSDFPIAPDDVRRLARLVEQHNLAELRYEEGALRITLRTTAPVFATVSAPQHESIEALPVAALPAPPPAPRGVPIEAPIMGIFYRSPAPGASVFVEVGDTVEKDQPIGMIEAMKVFSEILADHAGTIVAIPAENGKLVQPGDTLVLLEG